jgi:hypothetical protein
MKKLLATLLALGFVAVCAPAAFGQDVEAENAAAQPPSKGRARIFRPLKVDVSPPLTEIEVKPQPAERRVIPIRPVPIPLPSGTGKGGRTPQPLICNDCDPGDGGGGGGGGGSSVPTTPGLNLLGQGVGFFGPQGGFTVQFAPPDTNGATGSFQYVQVVNVSLSVFNKATGAVMFGPVPINTIFSGFGGPCQTNNDGDPVVVYDKQVNRWVITQFAVNQGPPYLQCVAVSTSDDATGPYNRYAYAFGNNFPDYPKLGVWPDGYYISFNMFTDGVSFVGAQACAMDRKRMINGQSGATIQCFGPFGSEASMLPSDLDGASVPPAGSPNYFINLGANSLREWKFHADFNNPANASFTGPFVIGVAPFTTACFSQCVQQPNTTTRLDALGDRLMFRNAYRYGGVGQPEKLVLNHSIAGGGGVTVRWYEVRNPQSPSLFQQGTFAPDSNSRWMGSIGMDRAGDIAVGYSISSTFTFPGVRYTGRLPSDPVGTLQSEATIVNGSGSQTGLTRWGDYSSMTIDPRDDCTFWYTQEYLQSSGSFNWSTRIGSFKFNACSGGNPVDGSIFFVRQHYVEFLLREPDSDGLNFWAGQIEQCTDPNFHPGETEAQCRARKRVDVSRAFWESTEFRQPSILNQFQRPGEPLLINPFPPPEYSNEEFVRICYRIYLQRDPEPDGLNFWTNGLNNCMNSEGEYACYNHIIQAFLESIEYRARFGQP